MRRADSRTTWLSKTLAGVVPGFGLAIALSGWFAWLGPGGITAINKFQVTMWLVPPIWVAIAGTVFLFSSATRAWTWLAGANVLAFGVLIAARNLLG